MGTLKERLKANTKLLPEPGEIWLVSDKEIRLHTNNRQDKGARPVLILQAEELSSSKEIIVHVVPLTTASKPDRFIFPLDRAIEEWQDGIAPNLASCALIRFYQPIEEQFFRKRCGRIDERSYHAIRHILITHVIGNSNYDLEIP